MELQLKHQVVLVTGGGQGVGRGLCLDFAAEGARVVVNDLFAERCQAVAEEINDAGGEALAVAADITDTDAVNAMIERIEAHFGSVDILVNNAGVIAERREKGGIPPLFQDTSPDDWRKIIDLNVYGMLNCCHRVIPGMRAKKSGKIISIMSEAGRLGEARLAVYGGAKAAILGFSKSIARELARDCINVNVVALGAVSHEGIKAGALSPGATPANDERLAKMLKAYPISRGLQRLATPQDVSGMVMLLASPRGAFITGQSVGVSGGFAML
ncbi:short-chain dehydrogenase [Alcanivorax sp. N3-2A]|nr:short-chain dehydrogenase [Alcanivorax sp. N3-2A]|tara:strand:- start:16315 stop:17127 length:813 start_codon:yes stop_codon:yes gene_type:complete